MLRAVLMLKLCFAFALVVSAGACLDEEIVPPPPTGDDSGQDEDEGVPIDPTSELPDLDTQCFDSKGDGPCTPE